MRTGKAVKNISSSIILSISAIAIGLIAQRVFVNTLGTEYLGIDGLFTNIVSMLALAELGLGSAIYYHLYKPLADGHHDRVVSLIQFYKKGYRYVALAVFLIALCLAPFIGKIAGSTSVTDNLLLIYLLFIIDIVFSYLLTYKRSVLYADQKNYLINLVHHAYFVILNVLQIGILLATKNYYLYLVIKIAMRVMENVVLTIITNRLYPYLKGTKSSELDDETKKDVFKKVRGLSYHKIAGYIIKGTDNILIAIFFGVNTVGLYSSYYLVSNAIVGVMDQAFNAITSGVGNLLIAKDHKKSYEVYERVQFATFWLGCFIGVSFLVCMNSFISLWIGSKYLLSTGVLVAISASLYFTLLRENITSFKEAAGIFHEDRHIPIIQATLNVVLTLIFIRMFGLAGVFIGTTGSTLFLHLYSYPKYVYKPLFKEHHRKYFTDFFKNVAITIAIAGITFGISRSISIDGKFLQLLFNVALCLVVPNVLLLALFRNNSELGYYRQLAVKSLQGLKRK